MVERNEVRKVMIARAPLTPDEVGELRRKVAKVERRNQRKLQEGLPPSGYVPPEVRAWKWVLSDWKGLVGKLNSSVSQRPAPPHLTAQR